MGVPETDAAASEAPATPVRNKLKPCAVPSTPPAAVPAPGTPGPAKKPKTQADPVPSVAKKAASQPAGEASGSDGEFDLNNLQTASSCLRSPLA